eukprot:gene13378-2719_t
MDIEIKNLKYLISELNSKIFRIENSELINRVENIERHLKETTKFKTIEQIKRKNESLEALEECGFVGIRKLK